MAGLGLAKSSPSMISPTTFSGRLTRSSYVADVRSRADMTLRLARRATASRTGEAILAVIRAAFAAADRVAHAGDGPGRPGPDELRRVKSLQERLQAIARDLDIQPEVLATRRELAALVRGARELPLLTGWRRSVVGEPLLAAL
jgi:ribonuclease D